MKGILHLVTSGALDEAPWGWVHWSEVSGLRADEAAWAQAWKRVHPARVKTDLDQVVPLVAWTPWQKELALEWLGLEPPENPPPLPENVRTLLEKARPLLNRG